MRVIGALFPLLAAAALCFTPTDARASGEDPQLSRLNNAGHSLKWNWTPPGRTERYGHAEALIRAPLSAVRAQVMDFPRYRDLAPDKFKTSRMVAKDGANIDMYFQIPVMHGMVTLWYVARFGAVKTIAPGVEQVEGKFIRGNIKDMNIFLTMKTVDDRFTILSCDLMVVPNLPAPQSAVDEELRDAAMNGVDAIHDRAQGSSVTYAYTSLPLESEAKPSEKLGEK